MKHTFSWMQLITNDSKKAENFYSQLFNWKMNNDNLSGTPHTIIDAGDGTFAGIVQDGSNTTPSWISYINVDDINAYTDKATQLGAQIIVPITEIGGEQGFYCVFKDPTGAILGLWGPR